MSRLSKTKKGRRLLLAGVLTTIVVASLAILLTGLSSVTVRKPELKTPWGEPDLQGIWTRDVDIPLLAIDTVRDIRVLRPLLQRG